MFKKVILVCIIMYVGFPFVIALAQAFDSLTVQLIIAFGGIILLNVFVVKICKGGSSSKKVSVYEPSGASFLDPIYGLEDDEIIKKYIDEQMVLEKFDMSTELVPIVRRKLILTVVFSILTFLIVSLMFFHISFWIILLEGINLFIYFKFIKKFNVYSYITKQVKARPDEDISNIVSSILALRVVKSYKLVKILMIVISFVLPLLIFIKPIMFFERVEDGYHLRFCTIGLIGNEEIKVPGEYNGLPVTGIRGNVFANMHFVEKIDLPDSIETIRGQAFMNDYNLKEVVLPSSLTYLGGSAFKNCSSLEKVKIPEGVTEINGSTFEGCTLLNEVNLHNGIVAIHGSAFMNCSSLENIVLPVGITEIRGNTFEGCTALKSISIPYGVTRIGGHAFYGCSSLSEVSIPLTVSEIGSSAFRRCYSLTEVRISQNASVNEKAFKETNTNIIYVNSDGSISNYNYYGEGY